MKLKKSINKKNTNKKSRFVDDNFWEDCIKEDTLPKYKPIRTSSVKTKNNNNNNNNNKKPNRKLKKIKYKINIYDQHKSGIINNCYRKLCQKIPNLYQEEKEKFTKKIKVQKSIKRSILLYSYGLEVQRVNKTNISKNKLHKEVEELKLCTWKPKLNNYKNDKIKKITKKISKREKNCKNHSRKLSDLEIDNECTFRPKINENTNKNLKKIFNKSKSENLYTDRENSSFIYRYKKARDEYLIRRFKQLSEKDDSYDTSFRDLTSRVCNESYRNYLNVNNNILINDNLLKEKENNNNMIFNVTKSNLSNSSFTNSNITNNRKYLPNAKKSKKYNISLLKKQLRLIDLDL